jgi:hypothetical protein
MPTTEVPNLKISEKQATRKGGPRRSTAWLTTLTIVVVGVSLKCTTSNSAYSYIFRYAVPAWEALVGYFDQFADERKDFLGPSLHDNLRVDDETFSRSRKYFWALSCLSAFNLYIGSMIQQWKGSRDIWEKRFLELNPRGWARAQEQMTEIDHLYEQMEAVGLPPHDRKRLTNTENVRLLTFVSIFFLPLAFCTSLGSMSDALFALNVLIYVIILVAFATYMVVFNLDTLARIFTNTYESHRNSLVEKMKLEVNEYWKSKGEEFGNSYFRPKSEAVKSSEWILVAYAIRRAVITLVSSIAQLCSRNRKSKVAV